LSYSSPGLADNSYFRIVIAFHLLDLPLHDGANLVMVTKPKKEDLEAEIKAERFRQYLETLEKVRQGSAEAKAELEKMKKLAKQEVLEKRERRRTTKLNQYVT
jgi:hypothetical protein